MNDLFCWESKYQSCAYSESLLNKIYLQNEKSNHKVDILEIKKAIYYAKKYHGSQKRLSGEPYYSHPLAVAELVAPHCFKTDILVTSILHDTIEDTDLTKKLIEYIFDANIASKVEDLTRVKSDRKISSAEMLELLWLQKKEELLLVKFFDRLHNMQTIAAKPAEKITAISTETLLSFLTVNVHLENIFPNMLKSEKELTNLINKYLSKRQPFPQYYMLMSYHMEGFHLSVPYFENDKY
jgi:(p)ppGpp synthase/HD superfamily hydrolase